MYSCTIYVIKISRKTYRYIYMLNRVWLCDPMDCSPPSSSVHEILQARILEWVAFPSYRGSSQPRDQTQVSCIAGGFFTIWVNREALYICTNKCKHTCVTCVHRHTSRFVHASEHCVSIHICSVHACRCTPHRYYLGLSPPPGRLTEVLTMSVSCGGVYMASHKPCHVGEQGGCRSEVVSSPPHSPPLAASLPMAAKEAAGVVHMEMRQMWACWDSTILQH